MFESKFIILCLSIFFTFCIGLSNDIYGQDFLCKGSKSNKSIKSLKPNIRTYLNSYLTRDFQKLSNLLTHKEKDEELLKKLETSPKYKSICLNLVESVFDVEPVVKYFVVKGSATIVENQNVTKENIFFYIFPRRSNSYYFTEIMFTERDFFELP